MTSLYDFGQDLRFSARKLLKDRVTSFVLLTTIALAIAVNSIAFGSVDSFLRPLRVRDPQQIVVITATTKGDEMMSNYRFSYPALLDFRKGTDPFSDVFAFNLQLGGLSTGGKATQILTSAVTGNYFSALGVKRARPVVRAGRGRNFWCASKPRARILVLAAKVRSRSQHDRPASSDRWTRGYSDRRSVPGFPWSGIRP